MTTSDNNKRLITIDGKQIYHQQKLILSDIKLSVNQGERIAILGKSGAGKSTLLTLLYQQLSIHHPVAWIPQQLGLVNKLSAFHNVYMGQLDQHSHLYNLLNLIWPQAQHKKNIEQVLHTLNLNENLFRLCGELSGGQQQRVAIARAIYSHNDIILADEPFANLDGPLADKALSELLNNSRTTIIALHNVEQAMQFADRIVGIQQGKIVLDAKPESISSIQLQPLYEQ